METVDVKNEKNETASTPIYAPPMIKILEGKDLLAKLQVSVNSASWWGAM